MPQPQLISTAHGRPALLALSQRIGELQSGDPLRRVVVVTRGTIHNSWTRRELARLTPGLAGVEILTLAQLAQEIALLRRAAADERVPVTRALLEGALRRALQHDPGVFASVAEHPATVAALARVFHELEPLPPELRDQFAASGLRAGEIVGLQQATAEHLAKLCWTRSELLQAAAGHCEAGAEDLPAVVLHLPQPPDAHERNLLTALSRATELTLITAPSGQPRIDGPLATFVAELGLEAPAAPTAENVGLDRRIVTTADADDEVRTVLREVVDALRGGTPAHQIAVVAGASDPWLRIIAEQFDAAGLAFHGPTGTSLAETWVARLITGITTLDRGHIRRGELFNLFDSRAAKMPERRSLPITQWRHLARKHEANGSLEHWIERLRTAPEQTQPLLDLISFLSQLDRTLQDLQVAGSWRELGAVLRRVLEDHVERGRLTPGDRAAFSVLTGLLAQAAVMDAADVECSLEVFARQLRTDLAERRIIAGRAGRGVRVLELHEATGLTAKVVVACGLIEGAVPSRPGIDPLITAEQRERLIAAGAELRDPRDHVPRQAADFAALREAADERLVLTMPRGDLRRTASNVPSRWLLELAAELTGTDDLAPDDFENLENEQIHHVQSFGSALRSLAQPATVQEHRTLRAWRDGLKALGDPQLQRSAELVRERRSPKFTRFDGNLDGVKELIDRERLVFSPTGFSSWLSCPHAWFMERLLGVSPLEPDDEEELTPLERGSLIHEVLERFFDEQRGLARGETLGEAGRGRLREIALVVCAEYESRGLTGLPLAWSTQRDRLLAELDDFLAHDEELRSSEGLAPRRVELGFGFSDGELPDVRLELPDGNRVRIRGKIDRIDVDTTGSVVVHDYKTGSRDRFSGITQLDPLAENTLVQLPFYAVGVAAAVDAELVDDAVPGRPVRSCYRFTRDDPESTIELVVDDAVLKDLSELVGAVVDEILAGHFPQFPPAQRFPSGTDCDFCAPGGDGTEVRAAWRRISAAPELEKLVALCGLAEPQEEEQEETA